MKINLFGFKLEFLALGKRGADWHKGLSGEQHQGELKGCNSCTTELSNRGSWKQIL